jgi:hypothetical protein
MCPHDGKHRLASDHGDTAAHFHIKNDARTAKGDRPKQLVSKQCACLRGKHDLSQIHEATQCSHYPERDAQKFSHRLASAALRASLMS